MKIEVVKIGAVKLNEANPRTITDESFAKLVKSIKEFPEMLNIRPIVVDASMTVLGGNMRMRACMEAGLERIPIIKASDLTDEQQQRFIIADNVAFGEWDFDALANEWDTEQLNDWGLNIPTFGEGEAGTDPFADEGVAPKSGYGVIVMCDGEVLQREVYERLTGEGLTCKIVVV